ncbi:hypothetical protein DFH09DRAFT_1042478 [Mycena vulgaris]|nr:hypothetical protein DFH09DRAFT_1042478 [Mycena vulgaris]
MFSRSLLRPLRSQSRRLAAPGYSSASTRSHTTDSYSKDVDSTPAADSKVHRVDPSSENVQKPHEPPSGRWSATGVDAGVTNAQGKQGDGGKVTGMKEYKTMNPEKPYNAPVQDPQTGGKVKGTNLADTSSSGEGPEGSESGGRKPEGR